ncbi:hypothetical protein MPER_10948 [Moniliophthora perniciosa FA553]|nr:hypothetical protein MPER_10948 [Moniliophthora perniciosa FA553]
MLRTHLTVLEQAVSRNPSATLFKVPVIDTVTEKVTSYEPISVGKFAQDVDAAAKYWDHVLKKDGIPTNLGGVQYIDVVNLYSVARAGYTPQHFRGACAMWLNLLVEDHDFYTFMKDAHTSVLGIVQAIQTGGCIVQMKDYSDEKEILTAIDLASLNRLSLFAPTLLKILALSRVDRDVLSSLASLHSIVSTGAALPRAEEEYAYQHDINIVNSFGMTETGGIMAASRGTRIDPSNAIRPLNIPGLSYRFIPVSSSNKDLHSQLLELVVLPDSIDCPDAKFLDEVDGCFHTGDLWEQVENGYIYCGRNDDWITCRNTSLCNTREIEDNVRQTCGDLVSDCIAVGNMRPSPSLFVESKTDSSDSDLKESVFKRMEPFNLQRMAHERIESSERIVVVAPNTLPRTAKGNIRRRAVEDAYKEMLDQIYDN